MRFPRSRMLQVLLGLGALLVVFLIVGLASTDWLDTLGEAPKGERLARIQRSPNYKDGAFRNPDATSLGVSGNAWESAKRWLFGKEQRQPPGPIPIVKLTKSDFAKGPVSGLRATWLGHSSVLVEIDGARVLFDPVWAERASPSTLVGPKRFFPPPLALADLPPLDAIVASHDHYDHLDRGVIKAIIADSNQKNVRFIVPLGVGQHLEKWGVAPSRITELDWSESTTLGALSFTATPARHFSGRGFTDRNHTLWASWSVAGPKHRVFHSGDTGPFNGFADIGSKYGPFDLTLIKIGAYGESWPDIHVTPEQAIEAHFKLRGKLLLPIHWGTFNLAFHAWDEPAERIVNAAITSGAHVIVPRPGESIEPATVRAVDRWWKSVQ